MDSALRKEIDDNYQAFAAQLPSLLATHRGKFALMKSQKIIDFFDTARDAQAAGRALFKTEPFSVQEVVDGPADLGFFSHALP